MKTICKYRISGNESVIKMPVNSKILYAYGDYIFAMIDDVEEKMEERRFLQYKAGEKVKNSNIGLIFLGSYMSIHNRFFIFEDTIPYN